MNIVFFIHIYIRDLPLSYITPTRKQKERILKNISEISFTVPPPWQCTVPYAINDHEPNDIKPAYLMMLLFSYDAPNRWQGILALLW